MKDKQNTLFTLNIMMICSVFLNFYFLYINPHASDLNCFFSWTKSFQDFGYQKNFSNYPPVFLHYLYLISRIFDVKSHSTIFFKFLFITPCIISHLIILRIILNSIKKKNIQLQKAILIFSLACFNPAIFLNSVMWGQIDILPTILVIIALLFINIINEKSKYKNYVFTFLLVGILCKFQMILFIPIFAGYLLHKNHFKKYFF